MDLCLRGSQINLATRQKAKPKTTNNSLTNLHSSFSHLRPRSATYQRNRSSTSLFLSRPQSADPKFGRRFGNQLPENEFSRVKLGRNNKKRYQSLSSTGLLKELLEEPVKRSWLCRSAGSSSPDEQSELSASQKSASYTSLNKASRADSVCGSSCEDNVERFLRPIKNTIRASSAVSTMYNTAKEKTQSFSAKNLGNEYWNTTTSNNNNNSTAKPDLPGRVSFSKPNINNDLDCSDCDNDKQEEQQGNCNLKAVDDSISAPGPVMLPNFENFATRNEMNIATQKKTVHFGSPSTDGGNILAETYEYPKCPSENCTCSTRSSSTASTHDAGELKCVCDALTCQFSIEAKRASLSYDSILGEKKRPDNTNGSTTPDSELKVIREYRNAISDQLENSVVKNLFEESTKSKYGSNNSQLNNVETTVYTEKYVMPKQTADTLEKQNNLSDSRNHINTKTASKRNLATENNLLPEITGKTSFNSSSDTIINNYLKVATAPPFVSKKKENLKTSNSTATCLSKNRPKSSSYNLPVATLNSVIKMKSSTTTGTLDQSKLKKAISFAGMREDSNLDEFNLDKVDSWMSMHEQQTGSTISKDTDIEEEMEKFTKPDDDNGQMNDEDETADSGSQLSLKSDDNSQDSTYDEIVSVIKEIEEDKKSDNFAECSTHQLELKLDSRCDTAETMSQSVSVAATESPDKYKDILTYLDNVEDSCDKTLLETRRSIPESNRSEIEFVVEPDIVEDVPKLSELLMLPNHQLARRVVALSLRANELVNAIHLSKEHVQQIRNEKQKAIRAEKANTTNKIRDQKKHYEEIVKRHQGFIEQLLKDKGSLCEKVAALTRRLESQNQAWEHKLDTEITKVKETTLAGEKIRRERWVRENTKKIKELTVKGLETEINKMSCEHQREITEIKRAHQQQLLNALEEARVKHEQIETSIRESCAQDREAIIEKERTAIRERFERQLEEEQKTHDEQKQKLCDEFNIERDRLQAEIKQREMEFQSKRLEVQRETENDLEQAKFEMQEKMVKQEEKYQNRINTIQKQYEVDFEIWKREFENNCKIAQAEKENTIRQHYRTERDRQIDVIVTRMDAEALKNNEEFEQKILRLKEKCEKDLEAAENIEKSLREKYTELRSKLAESDAQVKNYQAEMKQLEMELKHSKKMCGDFLNERDQLRENLRNEIQNEVFSLKNERDNEIQKIHKRVQQAIQKKDATLEILQKENGSLRERCLKLEAIVRQQRLDYCAK